MASKSKKVMYQTNVHSPSLPVVEEPVRKQYSRAVKQVVDTLAPGFNPRRTKNRKVQGSDE